MKPPDGMTADPLDQAGRRSHSLRQHDSARAEGGNELLLTVGRGLFGLDCPTVRRPCASGGSALVWAWRVCAQHLRAAASRRGARPALARGRRGARLISGHLGGSRVSSARLGGGRREARPAAGLARSRPAHLCRERPGDYTRSHEIARDHTRSHLCRDRPAPTAAADPPPATAARTAQTAAAAARGARRLASCDLVSSRVISCDLV